jgi:glycerophosphoryl diester phosphodiesterase
MITAHAGCERTVPNSIESVMKGITLEADAIEIDVRQGEGGRRLYLSHDPRTGEAIDGCLPLSDVFAIVADHPGLRVNCDLKEDGLIAPVIALARQFGLGPSRLILTGIVYPSRIMRDPEICRMSDVYMNAENIIVERYYEARRGRAVLAAEFRTEFEKNPWVFVRNSIMKNDIPDSIGEYVGSLSRACQVLGVRGLNMPYRLLSDAVIAEFKSKGVGLSAWTVDTEEEMRRLAPQVDNLTTRSVCAAQSVRRETCGHRSRALGIA